MKSNKSGYGKELILDLHDCDSSIFTRIGIKNYLNKLCVLIDMEQCELYFWDDVGVPPEKQQTKPHLKGTSAVQFILTSNITIHALDILGNIYINVFSCKDFNHDKVGQFTAKWFKGVIVNQQIIERL